MIIVHGNFVSRLEPLKKLRPSQGYSVAVVDVEDVYDEFSYGAHAAVALRDFLSRAQRTWKKPPQWVLLAGDASSDPRDYLGLGNNDFVPTGRITTLTFETASDEWLGDVDGDGLAEVAIGRLPVRTADEACAASGSGCGREAELDTAGRPHAASQMKRAAAVRYQTAKVWQRKKISCRG